MAGRRHLCRKRKRQIRAPAGNRRNHREPPGKAHVHARTRVLRSLAGPASGGWVRRVRGGGVQAVLRAEDGRAVASAGAVFPHAHDRLLRGDRQRARHRLALRGFVLAARFPAAVEPGEGSRPFLAVAHALASAARGARDGVRLGAEARGRARPGEGRADRRRRLDDGGQRRVAHDRAARQRRELSRDADADGARERDRDADGRGPGALRPQAQGQDAVERGLEESDRPGCQDRQDEGRNDASGLQAGARGRSRHRRRRGGADPSGRRRRYDDAFADPRRRRAQSRRGRAGAERGCALRRWSPTKGIMRANS